MFIEEGNLTINDVLNDDTLTDETKIKLIKKIQEKTKEKEEDVILEEE